MTSGLNANHKSEREKKRCHLTLKALAIFPSMFVMCCLQARASGELNALYGPREKQGDPYGYQEGYLESTEGEREFSFTEIVLMKPPSRDRSIKDKIFNKKLSDEFTQRYEDDFGRSEAEQTLAQADIEFVSNSTIIQRESEIKENRKEQKFGEYMSRRLIEYHFEQYAKEDPNVRPAWRAKERLSNVRLEVRKGYSFKGKYNLSSNELEAKLENPYDVDLSVRLIMDQDSFGPASIEDTATQVGVKLTPTIYSSLQYRTEKQNFNFVTKKSLSPRLSVSMSIAYLLESDLTESKSSRSANRYLLGLAWSY